MFNIPYTQSILTKNGYSILDTHTPYAKVCIKEYPESYNAVLFADNYSEFLRSQNNAESLKQQVLQQLVKPFPNKKINILFVMKEGHKSSINISKADNTILIDNKGKCVIRGDIDKCFAEEMKLIRLSKNVGDKIRKKNALESKGNMDYGCLGIYLITVFSIYVYFATYQNNEQYAIGVIETFRNRNIMSLVTYIFMHDSLIHLLGNVLCLILIGKHVENTIGILKTYIIYILGGVYGGIVSCLYKLFIHEAAYTIGSSGSVFAIVGAYSVLAIKYAENKRYAIIKSGTYAAVLIAIGFMNPTTDNACHIGGFIAGILITISIEMLEEIIENIKISNLIKGIMKSESVICRAKSNV